MKHGLRPVLARLTLLLLAPVPSGADVVFDGSLRPGLDGTSAPAFSVAPELGIDRELRVGEDLGLVRGPNLFHSFRALSLLENERLLLTGSDPIGRVIARVTGGDPSVIAGQLRVRAGTEQAPADLFLLNPAGLVFSSPAGVLRSPVDVQGSFFASTAHALHFADGLAFSAEANATAPLSMAAPEAWGFLASPRGDVALRGTLPLEVPDGQRVGFAGGNVRLDEAAQLRAEGGRIELAAVGDAETLVPLELADFRTDSLDPDALGEIVVEGESRISAGDDGGLVGDALGSVVIRGGRLLVEGASTIAAGEAPNPGGDAIDLEMSRSIELRNIASIESISNEAAGVGGVRLAAPNVQLSGQGVRTIVVSGSDALPGDLHIEADVVTVEDQATLQAVTTDAGAGPGLRIEARRLVVRDGALVESFALGAGRGGDVQIDLSDTAESLALEGGGQLGSVTQGSGRAGDVTVSATGDVRIEGSGLRDGQTVPSLLFARSGRSIADRTLEGDAGRLTLAARTVDLRGGSAVSGRSFTAGRSGVVTLDATESVALRGDAAGSPTISARTVDGDAGGTLEGEAGLVLRAPRVEVRDGASIATSSGGRGRGADLRIEAGELVVEGRDLRGQTAALLSEGPDGNPDDFAPGEGDTGRIDLEVGRLVVNEGGEISIATEGVGQGREISILATEGVRLNGGVLRSSAGLLARAPAGDISIRSDAGIEILGGGVVTAQSESQFVDGGADAGRILLEAGGSLTLEDAAVTTRSDNTSGGTITARAVDRIELRDARIETSVLGSLADTNAGNVRVEAAAVVLDGSTVLARAVVGDGGDISVVSDVLVLSAGSGFDASSDLGVSGTVTTTAPDTDLLGDPLALPADYRDGSLLLGARCAARDGVPGSFVIRGPESLPEGPDRALAVPMPLPVSPVESETGSQGTLDERARRTDGGRGVAAWPGCGVGEGRGR